MLLCVCVCFFFKILVCGFFVLFFSFCLFTSLVLHGREDLGGGQGEEAVTRK